MENVVVNHKKIVDAINWENIESQELEEYSWTKKDRDYDELNLEYNPKRNKLKVIFDYKNNKGYDFIVTATCDRVDSCWIDNLNCIVETKEGKECYVTKKSMEEIEELAHAALYDENEQGSNCIFES